MARGRQSSFRHCTDLVVGKVDLQQVLKADVSTTEQLRLYGAGGGIDLRLERWWKWFAGFFKYLSDPQGGDLCGNKTIACLKLGEFDDRDKKFRCDCCHEHQGQKRCRVTTTRTSSRSGPEVIRVPELTRSVSIKLNQRLLLRCWTNNLRSRHRTLPHVRDQRGDVRRSIIFRPAGFVFIGQQSMPTLREILQPYPVERRSLGRTTINRGALMFFAGQVGVNSCCVRDVTNQSAGIRLHGINVTPVEFDLSFDNLRTIRRSHLIWRNGDFFSVAFST